MATLQKINLVRRKLMQNLTRNIGRSHAKKGIVLTDASEIKSILICRPNDRLGNLLLITPLLQEINETFPNCTVDLFVKGGVAPIIFEQYDCIERIIMLPKRPFSNLLSYAKKWLSIRNRRYDLVINVEKNSSSGRLSALFARSRYKFFGEVSNDLDAIYPDYTHIAKYPVYNLRHFLTTLGFRKNNHAIATLDLNLTDVEKAEGAAILHKMTNNDQKTIALFTFATGSKCYSESWWNECYNELKTRFPKHNIIEILPVQNVSQIGFEAPSFYSKDVREIASVIANADVFIGADSGIMHLAASADTPTVGLFWMTNKNKYAPYGNGSFGVNTNETSLEQWLPALEDLLKKPQQHSKSA